ncbi:hypothetical protein Sango_2154100 [Sesamum angolense]|uniref:Uncharacterized protein n=1 Tax=Sesamum angolense TaxID=2727404 RepID=A0AAE1WCN3_9LAMI|nr:hypothetical protein Sango_2154100 [Sesamum angolense]
MAYHARSNSLPSKSHPTVEDFEDHLIRLKSSAEATSSSWALELLDGSMRLLDCCGIAKDITAIVKESVQELESSLRRSRDTDQDLKTITGTLKEAKAIGFSILKSVMMLLSGEKANSKPRSWSLVPKFTLSRRIHSAMDQENEVHDFSILNIHKLLKGIGAVAVPDLLKQLKAPEMAIQEIEEGLQSFFSNLVQERVSLLNALSH